MPDGLFATDADLVQGATETLVPLSSSSDNPLALVVFFGVGLLLVYTGFDKWKAMRLMQDTPTETIRAAAIGRTELTGTCDAIGEPIDRPFTGGQCVVADYEIEEWDDDDDDGSSWETVESGTLTTPFDLDDGTGSIRVEPEADATYEISDDNRTRLVVGAREREPDEVVEFLRAETNESVPPSGTVSGTLFGEKRRYTQAIIPPGEDVYVLGGARERDDAGGTNAERLVLARDGASDRFIVSDMTEETLTSSYRWRAPAEMGGGLLLSTVALYLLLTAA